MENQIVNINLLKSRINAHSSSKRESPSSGKNSNSPNTKRSSSCSSPAKGETFSKLCHNLEIEDKFSRKRPAKLTHFSMRKNSFSLRKSFSASSVELLAGGNEPEDIFFDSKSGSSYIIEEQIGKGNQAKIFRVRDKKEGLEPSHLVAKVLYKSDEDEKQDNLENEYRILSKLKHKGIIKVVKYFYDEAKSCHVLIEELASGLPLRSTIAKGDLSNNIEKSNIMKQIVEALIAIHERKIIHRDLTIDNIIYDKKTKLIKIIDFGLAVDLNSPSLAESKVFEEDMNDSEEKSKIFLMSALGLPGYRAPEMLKGDIYDEKIDIWMCGLVFIQLLNNNGGIKTKTIVKCLKDSGNIYSLISKEFTFLEKILEITPGKRLSAHEILEFFV